MTKPRILIADDDRDLLRLLSTQLQAAGYDVICAQDGYQALERARHEAPSLVLMDVNMPAGDGFSVQERMRKMSDLANVPVIYLTGEQSDRVAHGSQMFHARVLTKPFEFEQLLAEVRSALKGNVSGAPSASNDADSSGQTEAA